MQINPVNQMNQTAPVSEYKQPSRNGSEIKEERAVVQIKPAEETRDQFEFKDSAPLEAVAVEQSNTSLKFSRDSQTSELVVELVNNETGESLRQTPSEVSLKLSAIYESLQGTLVDKNY